MSPRFVLGRENVPCVAEVVNRSLKADCTDFIICYSKQAVLRDIQRGCPVSPRIAHYLFNFLFNVESGANLAYLLLT